LGTADNVYIKSNALQKMGPATINSDSLTLPDMIGDYAVKFICNDETGKIYANEPYIATLPDGKKVQGKTDENGHTKAFHTVNENETITIEMISR
ncbi:hypothetical protein J3U05_06605, partial [Gilliamella sp. B2737]